MNELTYQMPPRLRRPFRVGEVVSICDRSGDVMGKFVVAKAGAKVIRLRADDRRFRASDGWWIGESGVWPFPSLRQETKAEQVRAVQALLLMVLNQWPTLRVISSWTPEQRDEVEAWVSAVFMSANDNPVKVPKRPSIVDPWWKVGWNVKGPTSVPRV